MAPKKKPVRRKQKQEDSDSGGDMWDNVVDVDLNKDLTNADSYLTNKDDKAKDKRYKAQEKAAAKDKSELKFAIKIST
jgi:ribosome-binding factor A